MKTPKPSDLELQVLSVLWEQGPLTVRDLQDCLPDGKQRAYTTVLSVLQVMEKKGLVKHTRDGLAHLYHPAVKREKVLKPLMGGLVKHVFGGRPSAVLQCLLDAEKVDDEELGEIRKLIADFDDGRKQKQKGRRP